MTSQIFIPIQTITDLRSDTIDLNVPTRCSRCNATPATHFETHPLRFRAGLDLRRSLQRKFMTDQSFRMRLPLCNDCYKRNFTEAPETTTRDSGELARFARWRTAGLMTGSLIAGVAFILLMNVVPLPGTLAAIEKLWLYPIVLAGVVFAVTFGATKARNRSIENNLVAANYDIKLHRAYVIASTQPEIPTESDFAVFIELDNDGWARECAEHNDWEYRIKENQPEKENKQ